jgi:ABC-type nitrate/sulfonate/bicarbonate transport system substrate-binding protein
MNRLFIVVALIVFGMHAASYAQTKRIAVAYSAVSATQSSFYGTKEAGLFEKHGLFVDPVYMASGTKVAQAMIAGEAEDFIDPTFYNELEKSGFFKSISR